MAAESNYHSPLREQAKHATRARILDALVRVILDDGVHAFSVANVAKRAGVSHRTVYRHFATREELLEGLGDWLDATPEFGIAPGLPTSLRDFPGHAIPMFDGLARAADTRAPTLARRDYVAIDGRHCRYVRLILPLASDGKTVDGFFKTVEPSTLEILSPVVAA